METMTVLCPGPPPPPALRRNVAALLRYLTDLIDEDRRAAVAAVRLRIGPPAILLVIDGLIARLRDPAPGMQRRAAESLVRLGPVAVPSVALALARGRSPLVRARLARVLAALGPGLAADVRRRLVPVVERAMAGDRSGVLAAACAAALVALREDEPAGVGPEAPAAAAGNS
jgi:hypothetical protein